MELNEQGEYEPVEMQTKADVLTGGIFMLRQVEDKRYSVSIDGWLKKGIVSTYAHHCDTRYWVLLVCYPMRACASGVK